MRVGDVLLMERRLRDWLALENALDGVRILNALCDEEAAMLRSVLVEELREPHSSVSGGINERVHLAVQEIRTHQKRHKKTEKLPPITRGQSDDIIADLSAALALEYCAMHRLPHGAQHEAA